MHETESGFRLTQKQLPKWSIKSRPQMVIGGPVPSWVNSIPGPKYSYSIDTTMPRQPVFTMRGRGEPKEKLARPASEPALPQQVSTQQIDAGYRVTKPRLPEWSLFSKPKMVSGDSVPSWIASIPGPKYNPKVDAFRKSAPTFSMGKKLPGELDNLKSRSPGPVHYTGSAVDSKKQETCDSTRERSFSCGFGVGKRWEGTEYEMARRGLLARFNRSF